MDIYTEPRPAPQHRWWLGGGWAVLWALGLLFCLVTITQAQTPSLQYEIGHRVYTAEVVLPGESVEVGVTITNTGAISIPSLPLTATFDNQYLTLDWASLPPDSDNSAGQLLWNNIIENCNYPPSPLAPGQSCTIILAFTAIDDTSALPGQQTEVTVQSGNQQSRADIRIDAPTQQLLPRNPFDYAPIWNSATGKLGNATTVAWGDVDSDGDLDLAIGYSSPNGLRLYINQAGVLQTEIDRPWQGDQAGDVRNLAWGDVNTDGFLDLAIAADDKVLLYHNQSGQLLKSPDVIAQDVTATSVAWGDVDGDGALDLAVASDKGAQIYRNQSGQFGAPPLWTAPEADPASALAWGDLAGDQVLNLAVGSGGQIRLYRFAKSQAGLLLPIAAAQTLAVGATVQDVAWGDVNRDQQLDLAVGTEGDAQVYLAETGSLAMAPAWSVFFFQWGANAVVWGDVNADGGLDLVAINKRGESALFLNQPSPLPWSLMKPGISVGVKNIWYTDGALGDLNGDGMLDLAVAEDAESPKVFINHESRLPIMPTFSSRADKYESLAWGDVDNDGDLDLAVGRYDWPIQLYHNLGRQLSPTPTWTATTPVDVRTLAWGDVNGDGYLDLAMASDLKIQLYFNENGQLQSTAGWSANDSGLTKKLAWGDVDGDGDLDLAAARNYATDVIYLYHQGQLQRDPAWYSPVGNLNFSTDVAWGDVDGDGDLDLAIASSSQPSTLYRNDGVDATAKPRLIQIWQTPTVENDETIAWGDVDSDGDLDLAIGTSFGPSKIYFNDNGTLPRQPGWQSRDVDGANGLAWGDADGDGDLDLAAADASTPLKVYLNERGGLQDTAERTWLLSSGQDYYGSVVAWGDVNGDGAQDLGYINAVNNGYFINLFINRAVVPVLSTTTTPTAVAIQLRSRQPVPNFSQQTTSALAPANFYALAGVRSANIIPISYTLTGPAGAQVSAVQGFYSPNGGGRWYTATATNDTITQNLPINPTGANYLFNWDVGRSGFLGQSDNVVFRLRVLPSLKPRVGGVAGPYQLGATASQTFPFRVRGKQVRVVSAPTQTPISQTLVYRLPAGQATGALPITDQTGAPYRTDGQGYLQGRGQLAIGDRLVALAPITATESYTLYYTSATPTLTGLNVYTVTTAGVQTLTVSSANPLLLFNLDVALEWDARKDTAFVEQLKFDLRRTSEFLFDATDGQAALGEITLYHNKEQWERADIRIYASNALIPNADPGGIVTSEVNEIIASNPFIGATTPYSITYQPGRIRMGAVWNRFGEATGTLGEDWPRTLAHEIGHYAFYLYDNYLGLKDGVVAPVDTCTGTMMADQYREDFSEFRTVDNWTAACGQTISAQRSGRADWQTITRFYPWLKMPGAQPNPGPVTLPLAVTQIESRFASTPTLPLDVAVFDLVDGNGAAQVSGPHAQAVLYTGDGRLLDLGHPVVDKLEARGAHVGDRLCVYDLPEKRLGCETITANDNFLTLASRNDWQPEIVVSPVTSRTVSVLVSNVATGLPLKGKLYPENSPATTEIAFVPWPGNSYSTTFHLDAGVLAGHIQIWVEEAASAINPRRESLTSYALGGSPGKLKKPPKGNKRSLELTTQTGSEDVTPAIAPDGQVLIYGNVSFTDGEFYALQKVNRLPVAPLWTTVVGDGYRILKSAKAPDLVNTSILFRYRGQDVPAGEENFLSLYFWDEPKQQWRKLPTVLNRAVNEASAKAPGPGLYVLMSSLEIPLQQAGWNLLAYPVQQTRPVTEALASIIGNYSLVYSYVITDTVDPWKLYAPAAPAYVNDLQNLSFGQGYWIKVSQAVTWLIKGPDQATLQAAATQSLPTPPATFYGAVLPDRGLTPVAGQVVQALINGVLCGQSQTQLFAGQIVYSLNVVGDGTGNPACIGAGQRVLITVAGLPLEEVFWQNDVAQPVVSNGPKIYLPTIWR